MEYNIIMNKMKRNLNKIFLAIFVFLLPVVSFAQGIITDPNPPSQGNTTIVNPLSKASSLPDLIKTILEGALKIGMPVLVLAIIYSGFLFVSAQGNSEKLNTAKRSLMYTLIGAAILLGSWGIAQLIKETVLSL